MPHHFEMLRQEIMAWEQEYPGHHGTCGLPHKYCLCRDPATKARVAKAFEASDRGISGARMVGIIFEETVKSMPTTALEDLPPNRKEWRTQYVQKELQRRRADQGEYPTVWERLG